MDQNFGNSTCVVKETESERYYLDADNDSHWYIVPVRLRAAWDAWLNLDREDENSWEPPAGAIAIGGSPTCVTFTDPVIG